MTVPDLSSNILSSLKWQRLTITLLNTRMTQPNGVNALLVFNAIIKEVNRLTFADSNALMNKSFEEVGVFFHVKDRKYTYRIHEGDKVDIEVFFCGKAVSHSPAWVELLKRYFSLADEDANFELVAVGELENRNLANVADEIGDVPVEGEICLNFLTPLQFKPERGKFRTCISNLQFIKSYERRFSRLFGCKINYLGDADSFSVLPYYWDYGEIRHKSKSQPGTIQLINGCTGPLYIKGDFKGFLPFLILGSELHTGSKIPSAMGYYRILNESPPYFKSFPDRKALVSVIEDVTERYDMAVELIGAQEGFDIDRERLAEEIANDIAADRFSPMPNIGFEVDKKDGGKRLIEKINPRDLVVQHYLVKTLGGIFDRIFEEESIGFRKGKSREKAIELVKSALSEGYQFVLESDIEDFFPSIDHSVLERLIDFYIPNRDALIKRLIMKFVKNGYVVCGRFHQRTRGLSQGSPLSPLLANLYLDSFDEKIKALDVRLIRYADDFIILTKTKDDAAKVLEQTESYLSEIGLGINKDKTEFRHISEGFQFLGIKFEGTEAVVVSEEHIRLLKKPLYITEPYLYISLSGEAVEIRKNGQIIESIPLRRLSEIIVMEKSSFSTALVRKCVDENIPLTMTLGSGYFVTTIKPDSKKYYGIAFQHEKTYSNLRDTEILSIAKELVARKIRNYLPLFRYRYTMGTNLVMNKLNKAAEDVLGASSLDEVRGIEGSAARTIFRAMNNFIDIDGFRSKKRVRSRPDRLNSLLNFGYYLLYSRINATTRGSGLNPYLGFLHDPADNYESLVADVVELFRARIDSLILKLINLKIIRENHFVESDRGFFLKRENAREFLNHFQIEMEKKHRKDELSLKDSIYLQIQVLKRWAMNEGSLTFYTWKMGSD